MALAVAEEFYPGVRLVGQPHAGQDARDPVPLSGRLTAGEVAPQPLPAGQDVPDKSTQGHEVACWSVGDGRCTSLGHHERD